MTEEERDGKGKPQVFPTNKYKNTTIYKIFSEKSPDDFYIGHTSLKLSHRFAIHRYECKVNKSKKLFSYLHETSKSLHQFLFYFYKKGKVHPHGVFFQDTPFKNKREQLYQSYKGFRLSHYEI